jgi:hypothetical protein
MWQVLEQIAQAYGLTIECGNLAQLRDGPLEVASIRDLGENVIAIHPHYARGGGLLYDSTGSYNASWLLSVAAGLVTAVLAIDLKAPAKGSR